MTRRLSLALVATVATIAVAALASPAIGAGAVQPASFRTTSGALCKASQDYADDWLLACFLPRLGLDVWVLRAPLGGGQLTAWDSTRAKFDALYPQRVPFPLLAKGFTWHAKGFKCVWVTSTDTTCTSPHGTLALYGQNFVFQH